MILDSIRKTLEDRGLDPVQALIKLHNELEDDQAQIAKLVKGDDPNADEDDPEKALYMSQVSMENRKLRHKVLKDLIVVKQVEDNQFLKIKELDDKNKRFETKRIPIIPSHKLKQLGDGRWIVDDGKA